MVYQYSHIENLTPEFLSMIKLPDEKSGSLNYLIVVPALADDHNAPYSFPTGTGYVSAALKASGRKVFTLNLNYKKDPIKWLKHAIVKNNIDVVLAGGFSANFWKLKMIFDTAKEAKPGIVTVCGGGIITCDPVVAMESLESADYGIIGEGEITVNALAYALETDGDAAGVDGVICRRDGKWSVRETWPMISDLNILPFPDYLGFEISQAFEKTKELNEETKRLGSSSIAHIALSRSCPYKCTFCFHTCGDKFRQISIETIFKQIDWLFSLYPIDGLWFQDELSFSNIKFAKEFCRRIKSYNISWKCSARVDMATKEMFSIMKESGCEQIVLGIESAHNDILKSMRKNITIEQTERALRDATEVGLPVYGFLIFGDPEETMDTFWHSIDWWQAHRDWNVGMLLIIAFPGTHLYKTACEKGIIKDPIQFLKDGCHTPLNLSKMTDDEYNVMPVYLRILKLENKLTDVEVEPQNDFTFNVAGRCPHCRKNIYFDNFEFAFCNDPQTCVYCKKPVVVNPVEYCDANKLNKNVAALLEGRNAAVWAISVHNFYWLLKSAPALKGDNVKFINKDKIIVPDNGRTVKTLQGKEVFTPDALNLSGIDTVIVPNNMTVFHDIRRQCATEFPQIKRIVHITELLK